MNVRIITLAFISIFLSISGYAQKTKEVRSEHFIINYAPEAEEYVYKIKDDAEYFYRKITQEFGLIREKLWSWDDRTKILIAKDKEEYLKDFSCPSWSSACVDYRSRIIYTYPLQKDFASILMHELTHIIFREYIGYNVMPLWLDEGMATYAEYRDTMQRQMLVSLTKKLIQENKYIKFKDINNTYTIASGSDTSLFYAQAFSMVYFLKERFGRDDFSEFLSALHSGSNLDEALRKAFRVIENTESFESNWKRFYLM
jgi:hypothetical protein